MIAEWRLPIDDCRLMIVDCRLASCVSPPGVIPSAARNLALLLSSKYSSPSENSILECGSLLPLLLRPACWPCSATPYLGRRGGEQARRFKAAASCRTPETAKAAIINRKSAITSGPSLELLAERQPLHLV